MGKRAFAALALLLGLPVSPAHAYHAFHVQPGDTVDIRIDISNTNEGALKNVRLLVETPADLTVDAKRSRLGPLDIKSRAKGEMFVGLSVSTTARRQIADVVVRTRMDTLGVDPDPDLSLRIFTFLIGRSSESPAANAAVDSVPPASVGPVSWTRVSTRTARIEFRASGDDGLQGAAHLYLVTVRGRHLKHNRALVVPATARAGERQTLMLDDLPAGEMELSVVARDVEGNESGPSTATIILTNTYSAGAATLEASEDLSFRELAADSPKAAPFLAEVARAKLKLLGPLYEVTGERALVLEEAATLKVPLDRKALEQAGLVSAQADLYRLVGDPARPDFRPEATKTDSDGRYVARIGQPGIYAMVGTPIPDEFLKMINQGR